MRVVALSAPRNRWDFKRWKLSESVQSVYACVCVRGDGFDWYIRCRPGGVDSFRFLYHTREDGFWWWCRFCKCNGLEKTRVYITQSTTVLYVCLFVSRTNHVGGIYFSRQHFDAPRQCASPLAIQRSGSQKNDDIGGFEL